MCELVNWRLVLSTFFINYLELKTIGWLKEGPNKPRNALPLQNTSHQTFSVTMSRPAERSPFSLDRLLNAGNGQHSPLERYLQNSSDASSPNFSLSDILRPKADTSLIKTMIHDQFRSMNFADLASSPMLNAEPLTLADLIKSEAQKEIVKLLSTGQLRDPSCKCCFRQCPCKVISSTPSSTVNSLPQSGSGPGLIPSVTDEHVFEKKHPDHRRFLVRIV